MNTTPEPLPPESADVTHRLWSWDVDDGLWRVLDYGGETRCRAQAGFRHRRAVDTKAWGAAYLVLTVDDLPPNDVLAARVPGVLYAERPRGFDPITDDNPEYSVWELSTSTGDWLRVATGPRQDMMRELSRRFNEAADLHRNGTAFTLQQVEVELAGKIGTDLDEIWIVGTDQVAGNSFEAPGFRPGVAALRHAYGETRIRAGDVQPQDVIELEDVYQGGARWRLVLGVFTNDTPITDALRAQLPYPTIEAITDELAGPAKATEHRVVFHLTPDSQGNETHKADWFDLVTVQVEL